MSLITWNPYDKEANVILSNNNLTASSYNYSGGSERWVRCTEGRDNGKWYWEIIVDSMFREKSFATGIFQKDIGLDSGLPIGKRGVFLILYDKANPGSVYNNLQNGRYKTGLPEFVVVSPRDIIGISLDIDDKKVNIFINGINIVKDFIFDDFVEQLFPADGVFSHSSSNSSSSHTANFGATPFEYPIPNGYLPYDYENADWFNPNFSLIKSSNKIQILSDGNWLDTGLQEPLTKADFETYGMKNLSVIPSEKWNELNTEFEVITWTDDLESDKFLEITTDPFSPIERLNQEEEFEVLTWTDSEEIPKLNLTLPPNKIRYLITIDSLSFKAYRNNEWMDISKESIVENGMYFYELEAIPEEAWAELINSEAHKGEFKILLGTQGESNASLVKSITVNYIENEGPVILNAEISLDSVHNEYAVINANMKDFEGDKISFKVLIKKNGSNEFVQVSPEEGWYDRTSSNTEIVQAFNYPYFSVGLNEIKLVIKDERGAESEWLTNITYVNANPTALIIHDDTQMITVIGDEDGDDVSYRLFINNEMLFDYTPFLKSPVEFKQLFDSTILNFGENNEIRLEVRDSHGGVGSETINVLGAYRGLMFKNDVGEYFVDDKGVFLKDLLFNGVLIGGQTSPTRKVTLENRNGFAIKNTKISPLDKNFVTGARIEISKIEMPFTPTDIIKIPEIMANLSTKDFYVRIKSDRAAHRGAYFYIDAKADPAE